jgi:hypothetical protein
MLAALVRFRETARVGNNVQGSAVKESPVNSLIISRCPRTRGIPAGYADAPWPLVGNFFGVQVRAGRVSGADLCSPFF